MILIVYSFSHSVSLRQKLHTRSFSVVLGLDFGFVRGFLYEAKNQEKNQLAKRNFLRDQ